MKPLVPARAVAQALEAGVAARARVGRMPTAGTALIVSWPTIRERCQLVMRGWEASKARNCVYYRLRRVER